MDEIKIAITIERYEELIAKEYAYEAMKHALEEKYPLLPDVANVLFFVKRSVEADDKL